MDQLSEPDQEIVQRLRWYVKMRWFLISVIALPSLASLFVGTGLLSLRVSNFVLTLVVFAVNAVFYVLSRLRRSAAYYRAIGVAVVVTDCLFISYFIYSLGGIESRSAILYTLPILMAAAMFGRLGIYLVAAGSAAAYDFIILANYFGWIDSPQAVTDQATNATYVINTIVFFTCVLVLIAVLADFLTRLLIRKEREASATASALRRAQAIAKLGSWEWDVVHNKTVWSDELYDIVGVTRSKHVGTYQSYMGRVYPDDRKWTEDIVNRALKNHKPFSFEHRVIRGDKSIRIVHIEGKVLTDKSGQALQLYGIMQDVTDERSLEKAKGDFVSLASHQLRTPASGVRMLLAMLRDGYSGRLRSEQQEMVEQAYDANERLLHIADDLLNVAKLEAGRIALHKRRVDVTEWLKTICVQQKMLARDRRLKLVIDLPREPTMAYIDPERLAMVVDNLLSNARKYTPARGTITVRLQSTQRTCSLVVADTGSGMTKLEIDSLFGKFTRLDNYASKSTDGTGLGLYLAKSIVDLHGGTIRVGSQPGHGSTFTVRLPRKFA